VLMDRIIDAAKRAGVDSLLERQKEKAIEKFQDLLREKVDEIKGEDIGGGG
jgi:lipopolysaccharide biosynthesis regulator YciM